MIIKEPPSNWVEFTNHVVEGLARSWTHKLIPLTVLRSATTMLNQSKWIHISVSHPKRLPTWEELEKIKNEFAGENFEGFHMIPKRRDYVNVHRYCLHIWVSIYGTSLPNLHLIKNETAI